VRPTVDVNQNALDRVHGVVLRWLILHRTAPWGRSDSPWITRYRWASVHVHAAPELLSADEQHTALDEQARR
jgi:hypothetical protein